MTRKFWDYPGIHLIYLKPGDLCSFNTRLLNPEGVSESSESPCLGNEFSLIKTNRDSILEYLDSVTKRYRQMHGMSVFVTVRGVDLLSSIKETVQPTATFYSGSYSITAIEHGTKLVYRHFLEEE